ncbi:MAG: DUF1553 domain-containing protein [Planctomycetota bacterium]
MKYTFIILAASSIWLGAFLCLMSADTMTPAETTGVSNPEESRQVDEVVDFKNDLIPMFTKLGCNAAQCHGSAVGRGGFKLSLFGGTPVDDYDEIVRRLGGRRVNVTDPESSLVFMKPAGYVEHGGGAIFVDNDDSAQMLLSWIDQGAPYVEHRKLSRVEVPPARFVAAAAGEELQLSAVAHYDDGSTRDVTDLTQFVADDDSSVSIQLATAKVLRPGRHIVIARYSSEVIPIELVVPFANTGDTLSSEPRVNFVDEHVLRSLAELRLPVSPPADDSTFMRRITLDLTGCLPEPASSDETDAANREAIIDELLASDEFVDFYALKLARLLRIRSKGDKNTIATTPQAARAFHSWLVEQLRNETGYDQMAREIITASGDTTEYGPAAFYLAVGDAHLQTEFTTEAFMGSRMKCANCHNHPLDKWTQDDFHGLAAIFSRLTRDQVIRINPLGRNFHPITGEAALMKIPGDDFLPEDTVDGRQAFADWLTARDNPYFAKAIVNRLWQSLMGRGLVEPVDDFRATNPATHPELLNQLADDFVEHGYDIRRTLKIIAMSSTYARSSRPVSGNEQDDRFYSHMLQKPMEPEVLADAISNVLGVDGVYGTEPAGTRAVELPDSAIPSAALDVLGRCDRGNSCEGAPSPTGPLAQKLHLFNGELLNGRISADGGRLDQMIDSGKSPMEIAGEFYRAALNRSPNGDEVAFLSTLFDEDIAADQQREALEDFVWSIVTCREFVTNH